MRTLRCLTLACFCLPGFFSSHAVSAESASALLSEPAGWTDLQPAADLKGWTRVAIPPTNPLGRAQWHVDSPGGVLVCDGDGGHEMLRFDRELADCIFHVEFRFPPVTSGKTNYNSGVFIRNSAEGEIWHQAQLTMDGGYLFGRTPSDGQPKRMKLTPTELRMKPAGEWNTVEVTARGKTLTVWFNGAVTCTYDKCEVPKGYIAVESEGYRIEFRNLKLKELK
jgi:hypothetical protein